MVLINLSLGNTENTATIISNQSEQEMLHSATTEATEPRTKLPELPKKPTKQNPPLLTNLPLPISKDTSLSMVVGDHDRYRGNKINTSFNRDMDIIRGGAKMSNSLTHSDNSSSYYGKDNNSDYDNTVGIGNFTASDKTVPSMSLSLLSPSLPLVAVADCSDNHGKQQIKTTMKMDKATIIFQGNDKSEIVSASQNTSNQYKRGDGAINSENVDNLIEQSLNSKNGDFYDGNDPTQKAMYNILTNGKPPTPHDPFSQHLHENIFKKNTDILFRRSIMSPLLPPSLPSPSPSPSPSTSPLPPTPTPPPPSPSSLKLQLSSLDADQTTRLTTAIIATSTTQSTLSLPSSSQSPILNLTQPLSYEGDNITSTKKSLLVPSKQNSPPIPFKKDSSVKSKPLLDSLKGSITNSTSKPPPASSIGNNTRRTKPPSASSKVFLDIITETTTSNPKPKPTNLQIQTLKSKITQKSKWPPILECGDVMNAVALVVDEKSILSGVGVGGRFSVGDDCMDVCVTPTLCASKRKKQAFIKSPVNYSLSSVLTTKKRKTHATKPPSAPGTPKAAEIHKYRITSVNPKRFNPTSASFKLAKKMGLPKGWTAFSDSNGRYRFRNPAGDLRFQSKRAVFDYLDLPLPPPGQNIMSDSSDSSSSSSNDDSSQKEEEKYSQNHNNSTKEANVIEELCIPVGTRVEARYNGECDYFEGKITNFSSKNGTYDIDYEDGDKEKNIQRHLIRVLPLLTGGGSAVASFQTNNKKNINVNKSEVDGVESVKDNWKLCTGARVEADHGVMSEFYPGKIYDNGDRELKVRDDLICALGNGRGGKGGIFIEEEGRGACSSKGIVRKGNGSDSVKIICPSKAERYENLKNEMKMLEKMKLKVDAKTQRMQWMTTGMTEDEIQAAKKTRDRYHELKRQLKKIYPDIVDKFRMENTSNKEAKDEDGSGSESASVVIGKDSGGDVNMTKIAASVEERNIGVANCSVDCIDVCGNSGENNAGDTDLTNFAPLVDKRRVFGCGTDFSDGDGSVEGNSGSKEKVEGKPLRKVTVDHQEEEQWDVGGELMPLPPPECLPILPSTPHCRWSYDSGTRVLLAQFYPNTNIDTEIGKQQNNNHPITIDPIDEEFLLRMMEKDDITVVSEGFVSGLDARLWNLEYIDQCRGESYFHKIRTFRRVECNGDDGGDTDTTPNRKRRSSVHVTHKEQNGFQSMKTKDYISYLRRRQSVMVAASNSNDSHDSTSTAKVDPFFRYTDLDGKQISINVLNVLYIIDFDMTKLLPVLYEDLKSSFLFPGLLPGGAHCMMNQVAISGRPFMGPNLYMTPPGAFTHFHQDGHGTVDSGHQCIAGYNEVVMLRRMSDARKRHSLELLHNMGSDNNDKCRQGKEHNEIGERKYDALYGLPHGDENGEKPPWPSQEAIKECKRMNYCPSVFILKPGQFMHINKGRIHAFRKMSTTSLPTSDCHSLLRKALIQDECITTEVFCLSIAWDWIYRGYTRGGIKEELESTLACTRLSQERKKPSLAIIETSLLHLALTTVSQLEQENETGQDGGKNSLDLMPICFPNVTSVKQCIPSPTTILWGIQNCLKQVIEKHAEAFSNISRDFSHTSTSTTPPSKLPVGNQITFSSTPNAHQDPALFPLDPFGDDFFCKLCNSELSNMYMHCDGCEELLKKDFNICLECHSAKKYQVCHTMCPDNIVNSFVQHTGNMPISHGTYNCLNNQSCWKCGKCSGCSCVCHTQFTLNFRFMTIDDERDLLCRVNSALAQL